MTETLANGYSSESTQRELSNEYQHGRVLMVFKNVCFLVIWTKVALALYGLRSYTQVVVVPYYISSITVYAKAFIQKHCWNHFVS